MNPLVLVVDDDEAIRSMVGDLLKAHGCRTVEADDGAQVFAMAKKHRPALIVIDVAMRGVYGTTAAKRLQDDAGTSPIPIVIYSGSPPDAACKLLTDSPRVAFVSKRDGLQVLWAKCRELLG